MERHRANRKPLNGFGKPMLDIHQVMTSLSDRRPIFHSEADFQFALAWHIKETKGDAVGSAWNTNPCHTNFSRMQLDIWLPSEGTVIELKYPRTKLDVTSNGEHFLLKDGADDLDRYDFVKDVSRIEGVIDKRSDATHGFAVLLTNTERHWKQPTRTGKTPNDSSFRIHDGRRLAGELDWVKNAPDKERANPIQLSGAYDLKWYEYSDLEAGNKSLFRYLAVEVGG